MLKKNYEKIQAQIVEVCKQIGKEIGDITVVAATKTVSTDIIRQLPQIGIKIAGENRCQELCEKHFDDKDLEWHFVGSLQTNKVKSVINKVTLIQSVDRVNLALEIDKQSQKLNKITEILIEVNVGGETSKSGVLLSEYDELLKYVYTLKNVKIVGLMSVMPINASLDLYEKMRELYNSLKTKDNNIKYLSMGMSGDYLTAIKCGANMIRLGRVLFGERPTVTKGAEHEI